MLKEYFFGMEALTDYLEGERKRAERKGVEVNNKSLELDEEVEGIINYFTQHSDTLSEHPVVASALVYAGIDKTLESLENDLQSLDLKEESQQLGDRIRQIRWGGFF